MKTKKTEKIYKELLAIYSAEEMAESFVFPADLSKEEEIDISLALKEFRSTRQHSTTEENKAIYRLLQLKFILEDEISKPTFDPRYDFGFFLNEYISRLGKKQKSFATEIDVNPTELSQIINKHRKPTDKLILRLAIHSNNNFPATLWFSLLEKERLFELKNNTKIYELERKHVHSVLSFSF